MFPYCSVDFSLFFLFFFVVVSQTQPFFLPTSTPLPPFAQPFHHRLLTSLQVIGVVRGRAEHGPRALGHRSLLSAPSKGTKERMNALKVGLSLLSYPLESVRL